MKKGLVIVLAGLMVLGLSGLAMAQGLSDSQTFNFSCTVEKYIEVNPDYKVVDKPMITIPGFGDGVLSTGWSNKTSYYDTIYANCPFTFTLEGDNDAGDGLPILAREELRAGSGLNRWDRLQTLLVFKYTINMGEYHHVMFTSDAEGAGTGNWSPAGGSMGFKSAPHDGEVALDVFLGAALPHKSPDFGTDNTWNQSADAGVYTCHVTVTYTAL